MNNKESLMEGIKQIAPNVARIIDPNADVEAVEQIYRGLTEFQATEARRIVNPDRRLTKEQFLEVVAQQTELLFEEAKDGKFDLIAGLITIAWVQEEGLEGRQADADRKTTQTMAARFVGGR